MRRGRWWIVGVTALAVAAGSTILVWPVGAPGPAASAGSDVLPNLDQEVPSELGVQRAGSRLRLGFRSAIVNAGPGPLVVRGRRARGERTMRAEQLVLRTGGARRARWGAGVLRYDREADHGHWHYLGAQRFELRRLDGRAPRRARKAGFCLGDRFEIRRSVPPAAYPGGCGLGDPGRRTLTQGITPGWGDDYRPQVEGQFVDVTGLAPGRYVLVHRADPDGRLLEADEGDNAASVALRLERRRGGRVPRVRVLARCPDSARCRPPSP